MARRANKLVRLKAIYKTELRSFAAALGDKIYWNCVLKIEILQPKRLKIIGKCIEIQHFDKFFDIIQIILGSKGEKEREATNEEKPVYRSDK